MIGITASVNVVTVDEEASAAGAVLTP